MSYLELALKVLRRQPAENPAEQKNPCVRVTGVRPVTCAESCYEVEPGWWNHRPWDGCHTPITSQPEREMAEAVCWYCGGERRCACSTCWTGGPGKCAACHRSGKVWIQ